MSLRRGWGWHPPQTTSFIPIMHIPSVWAIGMLSQGHVGASLYCYTCQVGTRFGDSGSLEEWKWCHNVMFEADTYHRLLHASIVDIQRFLVIGMQSQGHVGAPLYCYTGQVVPRFGDSGSLVEWKWCHYGMVEADIHLRPLHSSILDMYIVFGALVCCLRGIWVHPYTITLTKLAPVLGIQVHLRIGNDAMTSCSRLISTTDHFIHP
jgi:hypothetical protein